jgi:hypothetical protein
MKNSVLIFSICLCVASTTVPAQKVSKVDERKATKVKDVKVAMVNDVDAIKTVIEQETKAYFGVDYKTWMESWIHTPSAYWSFADTTGIISYEGWKAIEIGFTDYFVTSKPSNTHVERTWQEVKIYGDGAYARFKQRVITDGVPGPEQVEIRVLEKNNNNWKILLVGVLKKAI